MQFVSPPYWGGFRWDFLKAFIALNIFIDIATIKRT